MRSDAATAALVLPWVVVDPWGFSPFGPIKHLAVAVVALALVAITWSEPTGRVPRPIAIVLAGFAAWMAIAAVLGEDPWHAWVGTPDRRFGWLAWIIVLAVFVAILTSGRDKSSIVVRSIVVGVGVLGVAALIELGTGPLFGSSITPDRLGSLFGQPAYLGAAAALGIPVAIGLAADRIDPVWSAVAGVSGALGTVAVLGSQTRGAWVGLVVAGIVTADRWVRPLISHRAVLCAIAGITVAVALLTPVGSRAVSVFDIDDGSARGRLDEWQTATRAVLERPVFGYGPEGYRVVFGSVVDEDYERRHGRSVTPDRAHNAFLDVALAGGMVGAAFYATLVALVIRGAFRRRRDSWTATGVFGGVVAFVVQQFFLFPLVEVDLVFWALAGTVLRPTGPAAELRARSMATVVAGVGIALASFGVLEVFADRRLESGDADGAAQLRGDNIRFQFAAASVAASSGDVERGREANADGLRWSPRDPPLLFQQAVLAPEEESLDRWVELSRSDPNNAAVALNLGRAHLVAGNLDEAASAWSRAADLAPRDTTALVLLAALFRQTGELDRADEAMAEAAARDNLES